MPEQRTTSYAAVRMQIRDGDDALFRNGGLIERVSDGPYTHAAKLYWKRNARGQPQRLMLAEMREGFGGRMKTLSSQIALYPGKIDVFRPQCDTVVAVTSVDFMFDITAHDYGSGSLRLAFYKRLTLWRLITGRKYHTEGLELSPEHEPKHCSQAVCWSERAAALEHADPWQPTMLNDRDCEPNDLNNTAHKKLFPALIP